MGVLAKVPIPAAGVALGTASLGNLLNPYSEIAHWICFGVAAFFLILLVARLIADPESVRRDLRDPVIAGVSGTFPMALMVMSTYISDTLYDLALAVWGTAMVLHVLLMVYFTKEFIIGIDIKKMFASCFIVYVGIAVAGVTSPFLDMATVGSITVWFGSLALIPLFILITYRYLGFMDIPRPTFPLLCIYAAPVSLCIAGYIQSFDAVSDTLIAVAYAVACVLYAFGLYVAVKTLAMEFYPSYAALTFPLVISAIASKNVSSVLTGGISDVVSVIADAETVICTVLVSYVIVRYLMYIAGIMRHRAT
ncbi:MAG: TDT family transporter [Candidatus Methanomethylophilaceae archaeon]